MSIKTRLKFKRIERVIVAVHCATENLTFVIDNSQSGVFSPYIWDDNLL